MAMEDARYRESSQYRLWSFSPTQLADMREKTNAAARARIQERLLAYPPPPATASSSNNVSAPTSNANTPDPEGGGSGTPKQPSLPEFLTPAEESLIVNFNTSELLRAAELLELPIQIRATSAIYFKRFYVTNSVMTYPPQEMIMVALILGSKAEDQFPDMPRFTKTFNKTEEELLAGEFLLFQGLRFALQVRHPFRALRGAIMELMALGEFAEGHLLDVERKVKGILGFSPLMTDAYFYYTPSQIMLAGLSLVDRGLAEKLIQKTFHFVGEGEGQQEEVAVIGSGIRDKVLGAVEACRDLLSKELPERREHWQSKGFTKTQIIPIRRKLKKCCDPERWNLVELQRRRRQQAIKQGDSDDDDDDQKVKMEDTANNDDGSVFGQPLGGGGAFDPKRKKIKLEQPGFKKEEEEEKKIKIKMEPGLGDPFGGAL
ncbi:cyclin-like protein [Podospora fimiseda]|uniref:Cyclin-like protein n=1 Tax=Podospora fimiseda TaxID=252190 RepID=A0AAN7BMM6_9PEZI|nr:cyclin-like protein [Podospora fimiseda]